MGCMIVAFFHYATYYMRTKEFASLLRARTPQVTERQSLYAINAAYGRLTGHDGFVGYMRYTARFGKHYKISHLYNGAVFEGLNFTAQGPFLWLYWGIEAGIIIIGTSHHFLRTFRLYNLKERDWYDAFVKRIGVVDINQQARLFSLLKDDNIRGVVKLFVPPEKLHHPLLEVNLRSLDHHRDSYKLLEVTKTRRKDSRTVLRSIIFRAEMAPLLQKEFIKATKSQDSVR
jgi:hypothetical protein